MMNVFFYFQLQHNVKIALFWFYWLNNVYRELQDLLRKHAFYLMLFWGSACSSGNDPHSIPTGRRLGMCRLGAHVPYDLTVSVGR